MPPSTRARTRKMALSTPDPTPKPLPPHAFAPSYLPSLLETLPPDTHHLLTYLNSSYFSHPSSQAPTLLQLKQHAQAHCNLFRFLDPSPSPSTSTSTNNTDSAFDWFQDLDTLYTNSAPTHNLPLLSVRNTLATTISPNGSEILTTGCPLTLELSDSPQQSYNPSLTSYAQHANSLLEVLDENLSAEGGLLALLPVLNTSAYAEAKQTILGQWLSYTSSLVRRVSDLEHEVLNARDVLSGEALIPKTFLSQGSNNNNNNGEILIQAQDRYILTSLSRSLNTLLTERLNLSERAISSRGERAFLEGVGYEEDISRPLASIDIPSRLYRIKDTQTIFVALGHGISEMGVVTRDIEKRPFVQSVVKPQWGVRKSARQRGELLRARNAEEKVRGLRGEVERLRGVVERRDMEVARLKGEVGVGEARLGDLVRRERSLGERALVVRKEMEKVGMGGRRGRKEVRIDVLGDLRTEYVDDDVMEEEEENAKRLQMEGESFGRRWMENGEQAVREGKKIKVARPWLGDSKYDYVDVTSGGAFGGS
ncbi:MAG: hypothetical protein M1812_000826 [Candelaria pacifica]|nr:MAG: hypothetical protein M1812_000826 [Candelaria pacifica]